MITRENYEEFFLLYVDNELPAAARSAVEKFVDENPDLSEEWEAFLQSRVEPEVGPVFPYKDELLKEEQEDRRTYYHGDVFLSDGEEMRLSDREDMLLSDRGDMLLSDREDMLLSDRGDMLLSDHQDMLLSYVDGELDAKDRASVDALVECDPSKALELRRIFLTVSQPDLTVVFPNKALLYRTKHRRRLVPLFWLRASVAAAVLGAGAMFFLFRPHGNGAVVTLPAAVTEKKHAVPVTPQGATPLYTEKAKVRDGGTGQTAKSNAIRPGSGRAAEKKFVKPQAQEMAVKTIPLQDRTITPLVTSTDTGRIVAIAPTITADKKDALPVVSTVAVSIPKDQSSFATQALLKESGNGEADDIVADESGVSAPAGKTKLRKIFRRVSRAFGKTADRDDDGQRQVLISAFQVALK